MNILFSCIGRRSYIAEYFRPHLDPGDRIIGTSNAAWTPGFRACDLGFLMPDISSADYVPALLDLCAEQEVDALLSFYDPDIDVLSRHLERFRASGVVPVVTSAVVNEICFDKYRTFEFLLERSFCGPRTFLHREQAVRALETGAVTLPLIVKPRYGFGSRDLFRADALAQLQVFFDCRPDMLVQEMLTGQEYHLDVCNDLQGTTLAVVPKRKISMRAGETDQAETCDHPLLIELGLRLGSALGKVGHVGPLDVDLFVEGDRASVLEMNPRFGGGYPASHLAGADFPRLILRMIRGEPVEPELGQFRSGVMMMKEYRILGWESLDAFVGDVQLHNLKGQDS